MKKKFYPDYLIEVLFFAILTFELILILSLLYPPLIGREIDPLSAYQARPEWYYLWLFWILRYFSTEMVFVGGFLLPVAVVVFLILIPWIDKKLGWRLTALLGGGVLLLFIIATIIEAFL
jgi:ubiquinol-cytochrome c reductase cytochrome b subunit